MLEANPNLGWRDVQEILISTAWKSDPDTYAEWATNSAGFHFDHYYGAGLVDAEEAVDAAENWTNLGSHTNRSIIHSNLSLAIPDNNSNGITNTFTITDAFRVEHAVLTANISHTARGNLNIVLKSPSGMESVLAEVHDDTNNNYTDWSFSSVRHWGESSAGTWSVKIADQAANDTGTVNGLTLTLYGTHDADSDLIDDTWEIENFGNTTVATLTSDTDNDGSSDYDEWRAGTQPTNAASKLSIDVVQAGPNGQIGWQSVSGKTYTIEYSTNLLSGFQTLETNITATPPENSFTNLPAAPRAFYRIRLE
jgi:subtilisin-like proprotein convertase family protein